jgi:hypothetical protein
MLAIPSLYYGTLGSSSQKAIVDIMTNQLNPFYV